MKTCSFCGKLYQNDMNFCLDDGKPLENYSNFGVEKTASYSCPFGQPTDENPISVASQNQNKLLQTERNTENFSARQSKSKFIFGVAIIGILLFLGLAAYASYSVLHHLKSSAIKQEEGNSQIEINSPEIKTPEKGKPKTAQVKIEIQDRVRDKFGADYIRCQITNIGESIIENPSITLNLYKNDLKIDDFSGKSELEFLKPNQTIPIWISISNNIKYTAARVDDSVAQKISEKDSDELYPSLVFTDAKLTSEKLTSLYNFRPVLETFYSVEGIVENRQYEKIDSKLYVIFYDQKRDIVGIASTYPPELKKNEKAKFEASIGAEKLFGVPTTFEVIAVNH